MLDWLFGRKKPEEEKKPQKKTNNDKWMYDLLVQFLSSPQWRVNIMNFVDQNCIIFDNEQQNKFEYTKIHNDFKKLIAGLFDTTMGEIGLTEDKLIGFIEKGLESKHKKLFEQLLICDDFLKFKQVMVKRNKALTEQVVKELEKQGNRSALLSSREIVEDDQATKRMIQKALKQSAINFKQRQKSKEQLQEQEILKQVMEISKLEQKERQQRIKKANQLAESQFKELTRRQQEQQQQKKKLQEEQKITEEQERKKKEELIEERKKKIAERRKQKKEESLPPVSVPVEKSLPPIQEKTLPPVKKVNEKVPNIEHVQQEIPKVSIEKPNQQENKVESIEDRKKRLLQQRQLLKRKKMQERQKQLEKPQKSNVQTILLDQNGFNEPQRNPTPQKQKQSQLSQEEIARRRELMRKIKNKIIDDL